MRKLETRLEGELKRYARNLPPNVESIASDEGEAGVAFGQCTESVYWTAIVKAPDMPHEVCRLIEYAYEKR